MHSISRHSAQVVVSYWLSDLSSYNLPGYDLESSKTVLVFALKAPGVLAGVPFVDALADHLGCSVEWHVKEGEMLSHGDVKVASMTGATADLVHCELLAKNILSRASSIATFAVRLKQLMTDSQWSGELVSPFEHTPGFAPVEEYAMFVAGVPSSRNLSSILLPLSHIEAAGGVANAISAIKAKAGKNTRITVECGGLNEAKSAAEAGASSIRFNGLSSEDLGSFSASLKSSHSSLIVESSGDFDEVNFQQYLLPNVDSLTTRKMFNGYPILDFILSYESGSLSSNLPKRVGSWKRTITTAESEQTSADNGNSNVGKESGDANMDGVKHFKPESSRSNAEPPNQQNADVEKAKPLTTSKTVKKNEKVNGNRPVSSSVGSFINRKQQRAPDQNRMNQNFETSHLHSLQGNRRAQLHNRNESHIANSPALLSLRCGGGVVARNQQTPQQQAANNFLHQARMMALLSSRQAGARGGPPPPPPPPPPHQRGLIGPGPTPSQQWPVRGGPPHLQRGSVSLCCRNCGMRDAPGLPYCRNCMAPMR